MRILSITMVTLLLAWAPAGCQRKEDSRPTLRLLCGAGLRPAIEAVVSAYREKTGVQIEVDYAGSGALVARAKLGQDADLFLPGDTWYLEHLQQEQLVGPSTPVAYFVPVIMVAKNNPKQIAGLSDLTRPDVRVALGRPDVCQVGRTSEQLLEKNGIPPGTLFGGRAVESATVTELATWVVADRVDAAIVWDAVALQYAGSAEAVPIPPPQNVISHVGVGILEYSAKKDLAREFVEFLTSDVGRKIFEANGYRVTDPDVAAANGAR